MINLTASRINRSGEEPLDPSIVLTTVGCALVQGVPGTVKPGTGAASERFVGMSLSQPLALTNYPKVEVLTADAVGNQTLMAAPIAGTLRVLAFETQAPLTAGDPSTVATTYSLTGLVLKVHASRVGKQHQVFYQFVPTTLQARTLQGDTQPGGAAALTVGQVGIVFAGTMYTTEFDTTVDWTAPNLDIRVGANARFTIGGSGAVIPSARVVKVPDTADSLLALYFSA